MSNVNFKDGRYFLQDGERAALLLDVRTPFLNRSRVHSHQLTESGSVEYPLTDTVNAASQKIFKRTPESMAELLTYLRIVARLLNKPQIHKVLRVGQWSPLDESLAEILPQFNPDNKLYCLSETRPLGKIPSVNFIFAEIHKVLRVGQWTQFDESLTEILPQFNPDNKLYCLSETRPLGKIPSVNFIFAEGGEYLLPENKFDTIIFPTTPPTEILLAVRDYGKIYFTAQPWRLEEFLKSQAQIFSLTQEVALFELEVTPQFRQAIYKRSSQAQLDDKKSAITQVVEKLPAVMKKFNPRKKLSYLDEYIAEVTRAENILAEIYPSLHSDTIKFNFNVLKEFLIDLRLGNGSTARVNRQYEILAQDLGNS